MNEFFTAPAIGRTRAVCIQLKRRKIRRQNIKIIKFKKFFLLPAVPQKNGVCIVYSDCALAHPLPVILF